jgi:hypothetical protein
MMGCICKWIDFGGNSIFSAKVGTGINEMGFPGANKCSSVVIQTADFRVGR